MGVCLTCGTRGPFVLFKCGDCQRLERFMKHQEEMSGRHSSESSSGGFFGFIKGIFELIIGLALWAVILYAIFA